MAFVVRGVPKSLFNSTFAVCFALVAANSIVPCPVDNNYGNDTVLDSNLMNLKKENKTKDTQ